ncbi:MAG: hypothetical protein R3E87_22155 [Burkholderiaceae bacterium]
MSVLDLQSLAALDYAIFKTALSDITHIGPDALHIHAGLAPVMLAAFSARPRLWVPRALYLVVLLCLGNEILDHLRPNPSGMLASLKDVVNTLFWPVLVTALVFLREQRGRHRAPDGKPRDAVVLGR